MAKVGLSQDSRTHCKIIHRLIVQVIQTDHIPHGPRHDLESFIYVLFWITLRHASTLMSDYKRTELLRNFDRKSTMAASYAAKLTFLKSPTQVLHLRLDTPGLRDVLQSVWGPFQTYMDTTELGNEGDRSIVTHSHLILKLASGLRDEKWKRTKDAAVEYKVQK
ncbi:hypothetical protein BT69DRAFT_1356788 [Atractiella rhizophila]|nr:hypothetical protein BT69DRAFT_1356788 [Atractiella rhizophila]